MFENVEKQTSNQRKTTINLHSVLSVQEESKSDHEQSAVFDE